jgi:hypothetical protein
MDRWLKGPHAFSTAFSHHLSKSGYSTRTSLLLTILESQGATGRLATQELYNGEDPLFKIQVQPCPAITQDKDADAFFDEDLPFLTEDVLLIDCIDDQPVAVNTQVATSTCLSWDTTLIKDALLKLKRSRLHILHSHCGARTHEPVNDTKSYQTHSLDTMIVPDAFFEDDAYL